MDSTIRTIQDKLQEKISNLISDDMKE
jgi:hypothetical protein